MHSSPFLLQIRHGISEDVYGAVFVTSLGSCRVGGPGHPVAIPRKARGFTMHSTEEILGKLGMDAGEVAKLRQEKVV